MMDAYQTSGNSPTRKPDLLFENHHSLILIRGASKQGVDWLESHINQSGFQPYLPFAAVCEPRYVEDILRGATADGLVCR
jgi:hypothetical protein